MRLRMPEWISKRGPAPEAAGPLYEPVRAVIDEIQAYARSHGGEIELVNVTEAGEVQIRMKGACRGCPMSALTLRHGIEEQLAARVPGVRRVVTL